MKALRNRHFLGFFVLFLGNPEIIVFKLFSRSKKRCKNALFKGTFEISVLFELLICIIISHTYYLNDGFFGLFHPYYLYLILPIIFFVAKIVATVRLE